MDPVLPIALELKQAYDASDGCDDGADFHEFNKGKKLGAAPTTP